MSGPAHNGEREDAQADFGLVTRVPATKMWSQHRKRRSRWDWFVLGEPSEVPVSTLNPVVDIDRERTGICCSGGGIRSASFNLGALQAIQRKRGLETVRFLSAVSGGSYIAAAFAMVAKTKDEGTRDPPGDDSSPDLIGPKVDGAKAPPFEPGSPEEQYLRNRASYMAPTGSAKAYLFWRVVMGLLVNLLLIGAFITIVAALLALYYREAHPGLVHPGGGSEGASPDAWIWGAGATISAVGLVMGVFSLLLRPRRLKIQHFRRFLELWSLRVFVFGLIVFMLEMVVPQLIDVLREDVESGAPMSVEDREIGAGISASIAGILAAIVAQLRAQVADPAAAVKKAQTRLGKLAPRLRQVLIYVATAVLGPLLILAILIAATMVQVEATDPWYQWGIPAVAAGILFLFLRFGDLNSWSLHPFYRSRLCSAFALRRVKRPGDPPTGRAEAREEGELVPLSKTHVTPQVPPYKSENWPTLLVCAAANVSDPGAAPPGRGVTSFTFSPFEMGGPLVGGIETKFFEEKLSDSRQRDFTLPAAVAMSGAAVSPAMGKMTRPSIRFLMAMANVRLGVWLPNPRRAEAFVRMRNALRGNVAESSGQKVKAIVRPASFEHEARGKALGMASTRTASPRPTPWYLLKELLGMNSINDKFLYVTDGGHYENLGLVELLRRGCTSIYCFDASGGRQLAQLGDAIALARSELGVEIEFPKGELDKLVEDEKTGLAKAACAAGKITYTRSKRRVTGTIVYVPTVMTKDLPWDVHALKEEDDVFPHHSTVDQLFTDQKFEAYRVLGYHGACEAVKAMDDAMAPVGRAEDPALSAPAGSPAGAIR